MYFGFVYETGKKITIFPKMPSLDKKFKRVEFPYTSSEFLSGILIWLIVPFALGIFFYLLQGIAAAFLLLSYCFFFTSFLLAISSYLYGASIYYTQGIMQQKEEMLQALLEMANYISLNTSLESAFVETSKGLTGVLGTQFKEISEKIENKKYRTLGEAFEDYIPVWMEINPDFIKGLTVLQTAALAPLEERESMLKESINTIIQSYYTIGKRSTETLSNQAKNLVSVGVMLPMMSLILLPMISIFLPQLVNVPLMVFIYNVLCPSLLILFAMNFALNRVQVNTIDLSLSPKFKKMPRIIIFLCVMIAFILSLPAIFHFTTMDLTTREGVAREYSFSALLNAWLLTFGLFLAIEIFLYIYVKLNERTWQEMREVEEDTPHLLQVIGSYLVLNRPLETIISDVRNDYVTHGFRNHSVVKIFDELINALYNTKRTLAEIVQTTLPEIIASKRLIQTFRHLINFAETDLESAAKAAKMMRRHTLSVFRLDNYMQTLLNDTSATIDISAKALAPILAATAIVMAVAIVMSLEFITVQIESISASLGVGEIELELVDATAIIPPTVVQVIVGIYLILTMVVLGVFLANVKYGTDSYRIGKTIQSTLLAGFLLYSAMLLLGLFLFTTFIFEGVLVR